MQGICIQCGARGPVGDACQSTACTGRAPSFLVPEEYGALSRGVLDDAPLIGRKVDEHLVVDVIGRGGFGVVYLALQTPILMKTALKLLRNLDMDDPHTADAVERFTNEARTLASLAHPNIVRLVKFGTFQGAPYIAMEFVEGGRTLKAEMKDLAARGHLLSDRDILHVLSQTVHALNAAHARNIVHRDIKPDNIMLQRVEGDPLFVRVLDFGLAKILSAQQESTLIQGTPTYMAPEQFWGRDIGPWTDVYAVGLLVHELFSGVRPFGGMTSQELMTRKTAAGFDLLDSEVGRRFPAGLASVVRKATQRDPASRYRTGNELLADLEAALGALTPGWRRALGISEPAVAAADVTVSSRERPSGTSVTLDSGPGTDATVASGEPAPAPVAKAHGMRKKWQRWALPAAAVAIALFAAAVWKLSSPGPDAPPGTGDGGAGMAPPEKPSAATGSAADGSRRPATGPALGETREPASAPATASGDADLVVNTDARGRQSDPAMAGLADGVVVAFETQPEDGSPMDVVERRMPGDTPELRVGPAGTWERKNPHVAGLPGRGFAMVYETRAPAAGSGSRPVIIALQRFDDDGRADGDAVSVAEATGRGANPRVAVAGSGQAAVVWEQTAEGAEADDVTIRLLGVDGTPVGPVQRVNGTVEGNQRLPDVASVGERFLVVWQGQRQGTGNDVLGAWVDAAGVSEEFLVNTTVADEQTRPVVCRTGRDAAVVVWESWYQDGSSAGVYVRTVEAGGRPAGSEALVNTWTADSQAKPSVAARDDGALLVVWQSCPSVMGPAGNSQDGFGCGVFGQFLTAGLERSGEEFRVNGHTEGNQGNPVAAADRAGRFFVAWQSCPPAMADASAGQDGSGCGVFFRSLEKGP